ncbi:MAG: ATP-binding protein, partial [Muricomes sp.]
LRTHRPDGKEHEMAVEETGQHYSIRFREINWNGTEAYVRYVKNVTEEVRVRKEQARLEKYFLKVVQNLPGGIAVMYLDKSGQIMLEFFTKGFCELSQMSRPEIWKLYGSDAMAGIHPEDKERVRSLFVEAMNSAGGSQKILYRIQKGDKSYVWVENTFSLIASEDGEKRFYASYRDMTKELAEQERFRKRYNKMLIQHYRTPEPGTLIIGHCNVTQNRMLEVIDHTGSDILNTFGIVRENFYSGLASFIVEEKQRRKFLDTYLNGSVEEIFRHKDREQVLKLKCFAEFPMEDRGRYVQFKVRVVEAPHTGDITGILTVKDITDQIIADKVLYQTSVTSYDFVVDLDLETDTYAVLTCNNNVIPAYPRKGSYLKQVEQTAELNLVPEDREKYIKALNPEEIRRRLKEEKFYTFSYSMTDEKGDIYTKNMTISAVDMRLGRVCLAQADVTEVLAEERNTKAALEKALALAEEASRAKSEFLSSMSHDIRTPMNAIMGMTLLASARIEDSEQVADCLKKISTSSKHLLSLINDILDMSKIEQRQITLNHARVVLPELIEQISCIIVSQARSAGIEFRISEENIQNQLFYGDNLRISQVLINILSNAIKFTPRGGSVEFHIEEIPASEDGNIRYCFLVKDTGVGIPEKFLSYLFEPFTRSYSTHKVEGTGLGLSITKGLVDLMGGEISVKSDTFQGTEFRVELECKSAEEDAGNLADGRALSFSESEVRRLFSDRCFLVAEDNAINAEILCELLSMYGAKAVVVTDGVQAVNELDSAPPETYDAVLMDIQMPEMNGYQAARAIRQMEREDAGKIPIVAMTANAFAEDIQEALDAGMNAHVAKPIDIDMLRTTLSRVL